MNEWKQLAALILGYAIARGLDRLKYKQKDFEIIGVLPRRFK